MRIYILIALMTFAQSCKQYFSTNGSSEFKANRSGEAGADSKQEAALTEDDVLHDLPSGEAQLKVICSRKGEDRVRKVFCSSTPPKLAGLKDLQKALGIDFKGDGNGKDGNPNFVFSGHSSSLVSRFTSAINPRAIIFSPIKENKDDFVLMGFQRGEQFAEVISRDANSGDLAFFIVNFKQACNATGCTNKDLLTPAIEKNWVEYSIYEDLDLENTILDCKQCHQPGGPDSEKMLRMQELRNPWTHFFRDNRDGGKSLIADYQSAHNENEEYAGVPGSTISDSDPAELEDFVRDAGFGDQPNEFKTKKILQESEDGGKSETWTNLYEKAVAGQVIPVPYHNVKVTDPNKLAAMTKAYKNYMASPQGELADIREVFLDAGLRDMGFMVKDGLNGKAILINACRQCHNDNLNPKITRAKFNIDKLDSMPREEKDLAIERLTLQEHDLKKMPPRRFKRLTEQEIAKAVEELKK
ncbi:MAG: hypothetical protein AB7T49_10295 [Oligoflexales bacterium]